MKDRKEEIKNLVEYILTNYTYGDMITYSILEDLTQKQIQNMDFHYVFESARQKLIEYGCVMISVIGEGWRILYPKEIPTEIYKRYILGGVNKFSRGLKVMNYIDQKQLTPQEKEQFINMQSLVTEILNNNQSYLLEAQLLLGEAKRKELKQ